MSAERLDELIALAAMGELTETDERELDRLLADDAAAQDDLRSSLDVAAALQSSVAETPPASLRDRVLAATASMPQHPAEATAMHDERPPAEPSAPPSGVVDLADRRNRRLMSFVAAAAAALVLVVGAAVIVSDRGGDPDPVAEILDAPDVRQFTLTGDLTGLSAYYSPSERTLVVDGHNVRPPHGTNTFELWKVGADGAIPIGLFRPDETGRIVQQFDDVDVEGFMLGVTEEPDGGSEQPTLPILASA